MAYDVKVLSKNFRKNGFAYCPDSKGACANSYLSKGSNPWFYRVSYLLFLGGFCLDSIANVGLNGIVNFRDEAIQLFRNHDEVFGLSFSEFVSRAFDTLSDFVDAGIG